MNAVLIGWIVSTAFFSLFTIIFPTWEAYVARRDARTPAKQQPAPSRQSYSMRSKTKTAA